ncbi:hypothetical protein RYX36_035033, partial [Vicia faba]
TAWRESMMFLEKMKWFIKGVLLPDRLLQEVLMFTMMLMLKLTTHKGVNYYVKSTKFEQDYPLDRRERLIIDERVEREYFGILRQNCQFEMQRRQWRYIRETPP